MGTLEKRCLLLRVQFNQADTLLGDTADRSAVVAGVAAGGANAGAAEDGVVGVAAAVDSAGPVVAAGRSIVQRATVDEASANKEQWSGSKLVKPT